MDPAALAVQAMLIEVSATPTPGNVDRERDLPDLSFEQMIAGAVGARPGLEHVAAGGPVGAGFERAVEGMARAAGTNTQFGALLLLAPLVRTAAEGELTRERAAAVADSTTVEDAAAFYRAFDHVDVRVDEPPEGLQPLDVRRGSDAVPAVRERGLTMRDVMWESAERDGIAEEWVDGFERTFDAAYWLAGEEGPIGDRAARVHLELLGQRPDSLIATKHGDEVAREVGERASELDPESPAAVRTFAEELVDRGINPGMTADVVAGALFVALASDDEVFDDVDPALATESPATEVESQ